jgi:methionine salvage enolase-phosphatase E1
MKASRALKTVNWTKSCSSTACTAVQTASNVVQAISGDKAKDKSQGELQGVLKKMGYTSDQVMAAPSYPSVVRHASSWHS